MSLSVRTEDSARPDGVEAKRPPRGGRVGRCPDLRPGLTQAASDADVMPTFCRRFADRGQRP